MVLHEVVMGDAGLRCFRLFVNCVDSIADVSNRVRHTGLISPDLENYLLAKIMVVCRKVYCVNLAGGFRQRFCKKGQKGYRKITQISKAELVGVPT